MCPADRSCRNRSDSPRFAEIDRPLDQPQAQGLPVEVQISQWVAADCRDAVKARHGNAPAKARLQRLFDGDLELGAIKDNMVIRGMIVYVLATISG